MCASIPARRGKGERRLHAPPFSAKGKARRAGAPYPGRCGSSGPQMAMGRIEHTLLDEGRASSPTDLRPSPATTPYHKKCQMFLSTTKGRSLVGGNTDPMIEAGAPSTGGVCVSSRVCPPHRG